VLEEAGLEGTLDWYLSTVQRQTGLAISYERSGTGRLVDSTVAIHVYRVLQEALNNVGRHSGADRAWVRLAHGASGFGDAAVLFDRVEAMWARGLLSPP
jgi:signal transduction histidine kinase